ncbi:hypothetical protein [Paraburkholderia sp. BL10I2N1]|uniref:hypothetical protein n=1 Tax=Paraburkholderia sp. BL10I2N1 TaxID=1938796 RepID=UPI001414DF06|nr:hypothetical protein [Paraburkholderia sp. BL10I2N1]
MIAIATLYVSNLFIGLWYFAGALVFLYRPNGDGWLHSVAYSFDCLCNASAFGDPRETISSRAGKARAAGRGWGCVLCAFLGWVATLIAGKPVDHCAESVVADAGRRAIIPDGE